MLDDLKVITLRDKSDMLGSAEKQLKQLATNFNIKIKQVKSIRNVVVAGMGGSAVYGEMINVWPKLNIPYEIIRGYHIPNYVADDTLFIALSFSGNTEETLSALAEAEAKSAQIAIICSGGELAKIATAKEYPFAKLDSTIMSRLVTLAGFSALLQVLHSFGLIMSPFKELASAEKAISPEVKLWRLDSPTKSNLAKQLALELIGRSVVIYGGPKLSPIEQKWKININENAKNLAWANCYPEVSHNEFIGWTSHPTDKLFAVIDLISNLDDPVINNRFRLSAKRLSGKRPFANQVIIKGETLLEQLVGTSVLGDFVSIYLALLNKVDPEPVALVSKVKA